MSHSFPEANRPISGEISRSYDPLFRPDALYADALPDMQNAHSSRIQGARVPIFEVGSSNVRMPLRIPSGGDDSLLLETQILGAVSLEASRKGINMSRIIRILYAHRDEVMTFENLTLILGEFLEQLEASRARLRLDFAYPLWQESLRSELGGYQYYESAFELTLEKNGALRRVIHLDFVYSSACPCSTELAEHARDQREAFSIPHSQRSKARISVALAPGASLTVETVRNLAREALQTETQVMVKRVDEQAFAELNGAFTKFVEDAARLLYQALETDDRIADFQVVCAHLESLHSHDAVAVLFRGVPGGFDGRDIDYRSLLC